MLAPLPLQAVILFSGDNSTNTSAPDLLREDAFNAVARVCNGDGTGTSGSAVHLRGKYMLTARHVTLRSHVTFDGASFYARDTAFTPVTFGTADIKLFKLIEVPSQATIPLYTGNTDIPSTRTGGSRPPRLTYTTGTLIGWGLGRDINDLEGPTWNWGSTSTLDKRWGTNRIESSTAITYTLGTFDYSYTALTTKANSSSGNNEAAATLFDSGSGLFIDDGGTYKLAGITTVVETAGSSTFSDASGDTNFFVRITEYAEAIEAAIPDVTSLAGWKVDHSLYGADAENDADPDFDGISQLMEFALGGDPNVNDRSILPVHALVEDGGSTYLELRLTRPIGLQGISYIPKTTADLKIWPNDSSGIADPAPLPQDNHDGTETLIYRTSQTVSEAEQAFIRIDISEIP
ncbi:MAG: hypothetical protein ACNA77_01515 [Opitutales bacterium]